MIDIIEHFEHLILTCTEQIVLYQLESCTKPLSVQTLIDIVCPP